MSALYTKKYLRLKYHENNWPFCFNAYDYGIAWNANEIRAKLFDHKLGSASLKWSKSFINALKMYVDGHMRVIVYVCVLIVGVDMWKRATFYEFGTWKQENEWKKCGQNEWKRMKYYTFFPSSFGLYRTENRRAQNSKGIYFTIIPFRSKITFTFV